MHYGVVLNDQESVKRIGTLDRAPYGGAPQAPVLYLKPANTLSGQGAAIALPKGEEAVEIGATVGLVVARAISRISPANALSHLQDVVLAADLSLPHGSYYRPAIREKCFDGSLVLGPHGSISALQGLTIALNIGGALVESFPLSDLLRDPAQLLADVSEFMTLSPGDVLLVGVRYGAPQARAGDRVSVSANGLGDLTFTIAGGAA